MTSVPSSIQIQNYLYSYRRSAAGREILSTTSLRSLDILEMCTYYLLNNVFYQGLQVGIDTEGLEEYQSSTTTTATSPSTVRNKGVTSPAPNHSVHNTVSSPLSPIPFTSGSTTDINTLSSSSIDIIQPFNTYHYIMDRLRSITADGRIQNFKGERWLRCLVSSVRYHIFIDYLLGTRTQYERNKTSQYQESQKYDSKFNDQRIMDYIGMIISVWENNPEIGECSYYYQEVYSYLFLIGLTIPTTFNDNSNSGNSELPSSILSSLYIRLQKYNIPITKVLSITIQLLSAWYTENYYLFLQLCQQLLIYNKNIHKYTIQEQQGIRLLRYAAHRHIMKARALVLLTRMKATPANLKVKLSIEDILPWLFLSKETTAKPAWYTAAMLCLALEIPLEYTDITNNTSILIKYPNDLVLFYQQHQAITTQNIITTSNSTNNTIIPNLLIQFNNPSERITKLSDISNILTLLLHDHGKTNDLYIPSNLLSAYREDTNINLFTLPELPNILCLI